MPLPPKKTDLAETEFATFQQEVLSLASTPQHRRRAADAMQLFKGTLSTVPQLPLVPKLPGSGAQAFVKSASKLGRNLCLSAARRPPR